MLQQIIDNHDHKGVPHGVKWLILARMLIIVLCIAVLVIRGMALSEPNYGPVTVHILLIGLAILNLGYLFLLPLVKHGLYQFLLLQFLVDIAAETGLVFFTGGVDSNFVNLYFVSIMAATMLLSRGMSSLFAFLSSAGLTLVTTLYIVGVGTAFVTKTYAPIENTPVLVGPLLQQMLLIIGAFFVVGYLSGLLAERLALARSLNEEILQNMAEGVVVFDSSGKVIFFNKELERIFRPDRPIQLGDSCEQIFANENDGVLRQLVLSRASTRFEMAEREDEKFPRLPLEIRTSLLGGGHANRGLVMLAIDLSLLHRAELAERRAERFSAVSQMAAGLAHEIRNPLASVRGSIQEISRDFEEGSTNRKLAEIVIKESDRLNNIITNFLQFARQRPLHPRSYKLGKLLSETVELLKTRADASGVEIELRCGEEHEVRCDTDQIREVFLNLGVNALAAMGGDGKLVITCPHRNAPQPGTGILREKNADSIGITVSFCDSGPGLPPGSQERIFEPFYTTKSHGSGLGLAIAQRVVESHEGMIWVKSKPGHGAIFYVWLPFSGPFTPGAPVLDEELDLQQG